MDVSEDGGRRTDAHEGGRSLIAVKNDVADFGVFGIGGEHLTKLKEETHAVVSSKGREGEPPSRWVDSYPVVVLR